MKKMIVIVALLIGTQAQAAQPGAKVESWEVSRVILTCSMLEDQIQTGKVPVAKTQELQECEKEIERYIRMAAEGDDKAYEGLMAGLTSSIPESVKSFTDRYLVKLQMAQQRAILKTLGKKK